MSYIPDVGIDIDAEQNFVNAANIAKEALNKSRHASYLHIFHHIARKLLEIHQVFLRHFRAILGAASACEKSVCVICIPDLISTSLKMQSYDLRTS